MSCNKPFCKQEAITLFLRQLRLLSGCLHLRLLPRRRPPPAPWGSGGPQDVAYLCFPVTGKTLHWRRTRPKCQLKEFACLRHCKYNTEMETCRRLQGWSHVTFLKAVARNVDAAVAATKWCWTGDRSHSKYSLVVNFHVKKLCCCFIELV